MVVRLWDGTEETEVAGYHRLAEVIVKRPENIFRLAKVVDGETLMAAFRQRILNDCGVRRVEGQGLELSLDELDELVRNPRGCGE